jgi:hypothetical protein
LSRRRLYFCLDIVATVVIVTIAAGVIVAVVTCIIIAAGSFDGVFYSTLESSSVAIFGATAGFSILVSSLDFIGMYAGRSIASIESIPLHDHGVRLKYILTFTDFRYGTSISD